MLNKPAVREDTPLLNSPGKDRLDISGTLCNFSFDELNCSWKGHNYPGAADCLLQDSGGTVKFKPGLAKSF